MKGSSREILILSRIPGIGPNRLRALVNHFGDAAAIPSANPRQLIAVEGIERKTATAITSFFRGSAATAAGRFADDQMTRLSRLGGTMVTFWDRSYPSLLKKIDDPPPFLFVRGTLTEEDNAAIGVIGTRDPSPYGLDMTERFVAAFARLGITVVSGLARGIDTAAHVASARAGNRTIAVIGSGIDVIYPPENQALAARIVAHGAVITEFPLGTKPDAVNFPRRNRIVSGMTLGVLVVETGPDGGAMITAKMAIDQGHDVFAIPSAVSARKPSGTNLLIKEGKAKLAESVDDITRALAPRLKGIPSDIATARSSSMPALSLFEQRLVDALGDSPAHIDLLAERSGFTVAEALVHLLSLEFKGMVRQLPGKMFMRP